MTTTIREPTTDEADVVIPPEESGHAGSPARDQISLIELATAVLRGRWLILRVTFWIGLLIGVAVWAWPASYTATAAFTPQGSTSGSSTLSSLSGLAAQFGVSVPSLSGGITPDLYVALLETEQFFLPVVESRYQFTDDHGVPQNATYIDVYDLAGNNKNQTLDLAATQLMKAMSVSDNTTTGVVTFSVSTSWPKLSAELADRVLTLVDSFNLSTRQQQARALEEFTSNRLKKAEAELYGAEDSLTLFLETNRDYSNSPRLQVEQQRLQQVVTLKQSVYMTLVQTYEQARIDAVRNTPSIVIVQPAITPLVADKKHLLVKIAAGLLFGGMVGVAVVMIRYMVGQGAATNPDASRQFSTTIAQMKDEARRPWRWVGAKRRLLWQRVRRRPDLSGV